MKNNSYILDAINILKGIAYSQLMLEDLRTTLCKSSSTNFLQVFSQIACIGKKIGEANAQDLGKFLGVHRIAVSDRQAQYLVYLTGARGQFMKQENFQNYFTNGDPELINDVMTKSQAHSRGMFADQMIKNIGEIEVSKIFQRQVQFYRTIEKLKQQYIKKHGYVFKNVLTIIDRQKKGSIDIFNLTQFIKECGFQMSVDQFQALGRRVFSKQANALSYKQMMKLLSPFQPLNYPTYRKQNNYQKALDYINQQVANLNISKQPLPYSEGIEGTRPGKTSTGFQKLIQPYRNAALNPNSTTTKYFYDQNYYTQLKEYRTNYFNPNRDTKRKLQPSMIGPQYHDHFFSDYYLYLEERDRLEHYYNKFGKRYVYEDKMKKGYPGGN